MSSRTCMVLSTLLFMGLFAGCEKEKPEAAGKRTVEFEPPAGTKPPDAPASPALDKTDQLALIVLGDVRCKDRRCDPEPVVKSLSKRLGKMNVTRHDWSSDACKKIFEQEGLKMLPAFLFDPSMKKHAQYRSMQRYLHPTPKGKLLMLRYPSEFDPTAEICDNGKDDTGNGKVDCDDPGCENAVTCRKEIPKQLDVFVMSQCPFGTKALDSMGEVLDAFERKIDFNIHFIAAAKGDGFKSLHGQPEVDENIRELCAIEHHPKNYKYMDYIWCRNQNIKSTNWKECTGKNGIDAAVIEKCASGEEGKKLLREDIKLAEELGFGASPTWLANNRFEFHAIPPESIKRQFCEHNKGLAGCEKRLSTKATVPDGVCK